MNITFKYKIFSLIEFRVCHFYIITILILNVLYIDQYSNAQNIKEVRKIISTLSSEEFKGRGYSSNGDKKAASFIVNKLKKNKLKFFQTGYLQNFDIQVNTFSGNMKVSLNDIELIPAYDFLLNARSNSIKGDFPVIKMDQNLVDFPEKLKNISKQEIQESFLLIDTTNVKNKGFKDAVSGIIESNLFGAKGIIEIEYKDLLYTPSQTQQQFPRIRVLRNAIPDNLKTITLDIENQYHNNYTTQNIAAFLPGEIDSFIVFTAHYDHLGEMGKGIYFPGANDNASGVSMLLDLASHFSKKSNKPKYSIAFLFFSAEELGLLGSEFYSQNPLFPLSKIKFLVNLDLVGSGDKGITVVNGTIFKNEFDKLDELNKTNNYLSAIRIRGPAPNSDHYPFYNKGVKSFFIYTLGDYSEYHSVFDKAESLPLNEYEDLFRLMLDFVVTFQ